QYRPGAENRETKRLSFLRVDLMYEKSPFSDRASVGLHSAPAAAVQVAKRLCSSPPMVLTVEFRKLPPRRRLLTSTSSLPPLMLRLARPSVKANGVVCRFCTLPPSTEFRPR